MNDISQLIAEREHLTFNLERLLLEAAELHAKSMDVTKRLRKILLRAGYTERTIPYSIDPGYIDTASRAFIKNLMDGTQAESLIDEAVKHHATVKARIGKGGIA